MSCLLQTWLFYSFVLRDNRCHFYKLDSFPVLFWGAMNVVSSTDLTLSHYFGRQWMSCLSQIWQWRTMDVMRLQTWLVYRVILGSNGCHAFYRLDSSTDFTCLQCYFEDNGCHVFYKLDSFPMLFWGTMDAMSSTDLTRLQRYFEDNGCHVFYILDSSTALFWGQWMSCLLQTWLVYSVILRTMDAKSSTDLTRLQRYFEDNGCHVFHRPDSSTALFWAWLVYSVILRTMDVMSSTDLTRLQRYFEDNGCQVF